MRKKEKKHMLTLLSKLTNHFATNGYCFAKKPFFGADWILSKRLHFTQIKKTKSLIANELFRRKEHLNRLNTFRDYQNVFVRRMEYKQQQRHFYVILIWFNPIW